MRSNRDLQAEANARKMDPVYSFTHGEKLRPAGWDGRPNYGPPSSASPGSTDADAEEIGSGSGFFLAPRQWTLDSSENDTGE